MEEFSTPMMKQYMAIKRQYKDCLLFFRLGDFYELFMEDAKIGSQVLGITLTSRPRGKDGKIPMAGVPYHAVDSYLSKLVKAGYKVAICEQVSEPNKRGIVEREVIRVVTPGTLLDERALEQKDHNYLIAIGTSHDQIALAVCDVSTGEFFGSFHTSEDFSQLLSNELTKIHPTECILPSDLYENPEFLGLLNREKNMSLFLFRNWDKYAKKGAEFLKKHFKVATLAGFNISDKPLLVDTCAALIGYLTETQKSQLSHIQKITYMQNSQFVRLDRATIMNLELFSTIRERETKGSLLTTIDQTKTPMGGRMLKSWILSPLNDKEKIETRLNSVDFLLSNNALRKKLLLELENLTDIERILSKISIGIGNARDLIAISENMKRVLSIKHQLVDHHDQLLTNIQSSISTTLHDLINQIDNNIFQEPPIQIKDGGIIKNGVNTELDRLREIVSGGKNWIAALELEERRRTGINSLKLRFNKVFGYYIEISKSNLDLVPNDYIRKQTLVNGERFITPALKEREELILESEDRIKTLEYDLYKKVVQEVLNFTTEMVNAAEAIAILDCLISFAEATREWQYTRPTILYSDELRIKGGRHPVVERLTGKDSFVPNDIKISPMHGEILIITGPNMAGKSVYLRQTALITLLAHIGCFVPAASAHIGIVDAIFVRSGASDIITSGLSTFMVEMIETAHILNNATGKSLIIMDEIGRGTSTYDGVSIAFSVAEYLATHYKTVPKTLFATHYHELTSLEAQYPKKIKNLHMEVTEKDNSPIFLHTIAPGPASKSFGIAVASLAGVPQEVISRAKKILKTFEEEKIKSDERFTQELTKINIDETTPLKALKILSQLKKDYGE